MAITYMTFKNGKVIVESYTAGSAVTAGDVVLVAGVPRIASADIAASAVGSLNVFGGLYSGPKAASDGGWSEGQDLYWDVANHVLTRTAGGNSHIGQATADAATSDTTAEFFHNPRGLNGTINLYTSTAASTAVTNTTTQTNFDTLATLPASTLRAGDVIRVRGQAIATSTNSTDTLNLILRLGTTTVLATGAVDVANNDIGYIEADIVIRTVGASGTMVAAGSTALGAVGTATLLPRLLASTTIDTTAALNIAISATWSVASASNSVRLDVFNVQLIRK